MSGTASIGRRVKFHSPRPTRNSISKRMRPRRRSENCMRLSSMLSALMVVRCAGFFDIGFYDVTVRADVYSARFEPAKNFDHLVILAPEFEHAHFIIVADFGKNDCEITEWLQSFAFDGERNCELAG